MVLESLACGTPVVAANAKALPECVIKNETGFLFEPCNVEEQAKRVVELLGKFRASQKNVKKRFRNGENA